MKTFLECIKEAALEKGYKYFIEELEDELTDESFKILQKAADIYAEQSNSHKHSVMQAEASDGAEGATVGNSAAGKGVCDGHDETHVTIRDGDFDYCMACNKQIPRA